MPTNYQDPEILTLPKRCFIGMSMSMSIVENHTGELFKTFMPRRNEVQNRVGNHILDIRIYPKTYYTSFDPNRRIEKWAVVEVSSVENIPKGMKKICLEEGLYAAFDFTGSMHDSRVFQFIFSEWLPNSEYSLDDRPHFDEFDEGGGSEVARQMIYVPVKPK